MNYDYTQAGKVYQMIDGNVYAFLDGVFKSAHAATGSMSRVVLTGYTATSSRGSVGYQTRNGGYIILSEGWEYINTVPISQYTQTQAQAVVDKIIKCNKHIVANNLLCARYATKLTEDQQAMVRELQLRIKERDDALISGGMCTNMQTSYPEGYAEFEPYLASLMNGEAIGIATWAVVVIVAVVVASLSTAAYYAYKWYADQAEKDVQFSDELTRILASKLTDEEYQMLLEETRGIVTKARIKQSISTGSKTALFVGIVAVIGGLVAMKQLKVI